jgi:hypothetical protein
MGDSTRGDATGDTRVDALLREIVASFESTFPGRERGYYVTGSYSDFSRVSASDLVPDRIVGVVSQPASVRAYPRTGGRERGATHRH